MMKENGKEIEGIDIADIERYGTLCGIRIEKKETGPFGLRLEAYPLDREEPVLGYLDAFIRPLPFKLFHLDTIRVKNQRQDKGYKRGVDNWTIEGPGISFIMGAYALQWAFDRGCKKTGELI